MNRLKKTIEILRKSSKKEKKLTLERSGLYKDIEFNETNGGLKATQLDKKQFEDLILEKDRQIAQCHLPSSL